MKHALLGLLALVLVSCAKPAPSVEVLRPSYLDAIKPIQMNRALMDEYAISQLAQLGWVIETGTDFINICTAGSINREQQYWLTAAHCVTNIGSEGRFVMGQPLEVVEADVALDLAVFKVVGWTAKELPMQMTPPRWGQDLIVAGHPFGYPDIFVTRGYLANPVAFIELSRSWMIFDVAGAPGNSGSPVLNLKGEVVSVLQIGWGRVFGPVTGGATYETLQKFAHYFTPRNELRSDQ